MIPTTMITMIITTNHAEGDDPHVGVTTGDTGTLIVEIDPEGHIGLPHVVHHLYDEGTDPTSTNPRNSENPLLVLLPTSVDIDITTMMIMITITIMIMITMIMIIPIITRNVLVVATVPTGNATAGEDRLETQGIRQ